jgi:hypothetical protein
MTENRITNMFLIMLISLLFTTVGCMGADATENVDGEGAALKGGIPAHLGDGGKGRNKDHDAQVDESGDADVDVDEDADEAIDESVDRDAASEESDEDEDADEDADEGVDEGGPSDAGTQTMKAPKKAR